MHYYIRHTTVYTYPEEVFLFPHCLKLQPRVDGAQECVRFQLRLDPSAKGTVFCTDLEGNRCVQAWFEQKASRFSVIAESEVVTLRHNPFDFIVADPGLPLKYPRMEEDLCERYRTSGYAIPSEVADLARSVSRDAADDALRFLPALTERIHALCKKIVRPEGPPWTQGEALERREGSCRDLAVLFIDCCRSVGLPARFVSGYFDAEGEDTTHELHAWAEVYLPGAGWRGFDPSAGIAVADRHIGIAGCVNPELAAPVQGVFAAGEPASTMRSQILVRRK